MKKLTIQLAMMLFASSLFAQWVPVNNGLDDYPPTALWPMGEDMVLGTYGGGIYKTINNGESWENYNENLGNLNVNDIRGAGTYTALFVATEGGPFFTNDMTDYIDCTSTGLTNTDVSFYWAFDNELGGDFMVSTNGGGIFLSDEFNGPWTAASNISGAELTVSDIGGYSGDEQEFMVLSTDEGTYWAINGATEWTAMNNGLTGDALKVNRIAGLGFMVLIATDDGLYNNYQMADEWTPLILNEKLNTVLVVFSSALPTGFACIAFGENGFYSEDLISWNPLDLGGIEGEVTAAHVNSTDIFLGFTTEEKGAKTSGGIYRKPIGQLLVGVDENTEITTNALLGQNYPNPFNGTTNINYSLETSGFVSLKVYDVCGREIQTLVSEFKQTGTYSSNFDASQLDEGIYFYTLKVENNLVESKRMILAR